MTLKVPLFKRKSQEKDLKGIEVKRSRVLALFYVVAIRSFILLKIAPGCLTIKSVHIQAAKLKQFLQSRKYIYFWQQKI